MRLIILACLLSFADLAFGQCTCTDCPVDLPTSGGTSSTLNIGGSTNDLLGTNGQSLQAICLSINHDAIDEIDVTLIAPDGSSVDLIVETGLSINSDIDFNICFVACGETALPDPGFPAIFDSEQPWQAGELYTGSYYPAVGCLEDLTGSINGDWTLDIFDNVGADGGTLFSWCLQFTDDAGLGCGNTCFSQDCVADGGTIPDLSGTYCQGDSDLNFSLPPSYSGNAPDPAEYDYNYVLINLPSEEINGFSTNTDLTPLLPGEYRLCGFSYLTADFGILPFPPPTGYTFADLLDDLANNEFCADLSDNCIEFTVVAAPEPPDFNGPLDVCPGEVVNYEVSNFDPDLEYLFTISQGSFTLFTVTDGVATVNWADGPGSLCVQAFNDCDTLESCLAIEVGSGETVDISGDLDVCAGDVETYTITPPPGPGQNFIVSITGGAAFDFQDASFQVNWDAVATGEICVEIVGPGCLPEPGCVDVAVNPFLPPPFVENPLSICVGETGIASVPDDPDVLGYEWFGTGISVLSGQGTNEIEFSADQVLDGETCVVLETVCGFDTVCTDLNIFDNPSPMITATQPLNPECGEDFFIFLVFSPGTDLLWTQIDGTPGGITIQGPNAAVPFIIINEPGSYSVQIAESIGSCVGFDTLSFDVIGGPEINNVTTTCDLNGEYTVSFEISGGTAPYLVDGVEITGSTFTSDPIPSGFPYEFIVSDQGDCESEISGTETCPCITDAGTMPTPIIEICDEAGAEITVNNNGDETLDGDDALIYVLHTAPGIFLGTIIEQNTTGTFAFQPGMVYGQTYYVSAVAGNAIPGGVDLTDACLSVAAGQPVIFFETPEVTYTGPTDVCSNGFTLTVDVDIPIQSFEWIFVSGAGNSNLSMSTEQSIVVTVDQIGTYAYQYVANNGACSDTTDIEVIVYEFLVVNDFAETCDGSGNYTVSFVMGGGTAPYDVDGDPLVAGAFESDPIPSGDAYFFTVTDANGCTVTVSGNRNCDCITDAGTMPTDPIEVCGATGEEVVVTGNGDQELDANDAFVYVLHDFAGPDLGTVIAENTTGVFEFLPGMVFGQTYYVSLVVGNATGGSVDLSDPCLSVASGQPVIFYGQPDIALVGPFESCENQFVLNATTSGDVNQTSWEFLSGPGTGIFGNVTPTSAEVTVDVPGVYEFQAIASNQFCFDTAFIVVEVFQDIDIINIEDSCAGADQFILSFDVVGGTSPFVASIGGVFTGSSFSSDLLDIDLIYDIVVTDASGCSGEFAIGPIQCGCTTEAGEMSTSVIEICETATQVNFTYLGGETLDADDIERFILHSGAGEVIVDPVLESNSPSISIPPGLLQPGVTYYLSHVVGNDAGGNVDLTDPCLGVAPGQPLVIGTEPQFTLSGDVESCPGAVGISVNNGVPSNGQVTLIGNSGGANINLTLDNNTITVGSAIPTVVTVEYAEITGACERRDTVMVTFFETPEVSNVSDLCFGDEFVVVFDISSGLAPYTVNGQTLSGSTFTSDTFPSGSPVDFAVLDSRGCTAFLSLNVDCNCVTDAGVLSGDIPVACAGDTLDINSISLVGVQLEVEDTVYLVVHNGDANTLGSILFNPQLGIVPFDTSVFESGETYFLSAIAGNALNGEVDLNDPCFSVSNGLPIQWGSAATAEIEQGEITACVGEVVEFNLFATGNFPFEVFVSSSTGREGVLTITSEVSSIIAIALDTVETWTVDSINAPCAQIGSGIFTIIGDSLSAPSFNSVPELCNEAQFGSVLDLNSLLDNQIVGVWTSNDLTVAGDSIDVSGIAAGVYQVIFSTVDSSGSCPGDEYPIPIIVNDCQCPTISVPDTVRYCNSTDAVDLTSELPIALSGSWSLSNSQGSPEPPTVSGGILSLFGADAGRYELTYFILDSVPDGCPTSVGVVLEIFGEVQAGDVILVPTYCQNSGEIIDLPDLLSGEDPGGTWIFSGDTIAPVINSDILNIGVNTISYVVAATGPCQDAEQLVEINIIDIPDAGIQTVFPTLCDSDSSELFLPDLLDGETAGGLWIFEGDTIGPSLPVAGLTPGFSAIEYVVGSTAECNASSIVDIEVVPLPSYFLVARNISCNGADDGLLSVEPADGGNGPYTVRINAQERQVILSPPAGDYFIEIEDVFGCTTSQLVSITEPPPVTVDLEAPVIVENGESFTANAFADGQGFLQYTWLVGTDTLSENAPTVRVALDSSTTLTVLVTDEEGCSAQSAISIMVEEEQEPDVEVNVFIPNVFNPTSDNIENRTFGVSRVADIANVDYFRVFDRWGALVYGVEDQPGGSNLLEWDGRHRGTLVNPGVFVYTVSYTTIDGAEEVRIGDVTVVR